MKIVLSWLKELVDVAGTPGELAADLTMVGLPVDAVMATGATPGVVVARVLERTPHPKADRLTRVVLDDGSGVQDATRVVVSGAPNVPEVGGLVLWAPPGTRLPAAPDRPLEPKSFKGIDSFGMLCSEVELGLGEDKEGLLVLAPGDLPAGALVPGSPLRLDDVVLELDVTPNRPDALGHVGVAREVAALRGGELRLPVARSVPLAAAGEGPPVEIQDLEGCPRYIGQLLTGLTVGRSPLWLRHRLHLAGVRPISNVVDVTNLVLLELSQPLHAFDLARLEGGRIVVRRAAAGEKMTTLDGVERSLLATDLVIADARRPVALAGVMGGHDSEVTGATRDVLLESAYFSPPGIRSTSKRTGLHTEASHRFERGVDPVQVSYAAARAAGLLGELAGARAQGSPRDVYPHPIPRRRIRADLARVEQLVGLPLSVEVATRRLHGLGFGITVAHGAGVEQALAESHQPVTLEVEVPPWRPDINLEVDVVEELARAERGYDQIPTALPPSTLSPAAGGLSLGPAVREALIASGCMEALTYSFISAVELGALGLSDEDRRSRPLALINPLREEQSVMRTSLLVGLLGALARNQSRGTRQVRLFELGRVFLRRQAGQQAPVVAADLRLPEERRQAAFLLAGDTDGWLREGPGFDFFDGKGVVEELLSCLGFLPGRLTFEASGEGYHHPGAGARVLIDGVVVGQVGELHPEVARRRDLQGPVVVGEVDLESLEPLWHRDRQVVELPRYPSVSRDISCFVDVATPAAEVERQLLSAREPLLESVAPLEDYREAGKVPVGKKALLFGLSYRSRERTLTDEEVNRAHEALVADLVSRLGIERR